MTTHDKEAMTMDDFWGEPISVYTRQQAIEDGVLVDVSEMAREAGFTIPVALTSGVFYECVQWPEDDGTQDEAGRLWDVLMMLYFGIKRSPGGDRIDYELIVRQRDGSMRTTALYATVGPGDTAAPVITIMLPNED
jgi:hypothetical protein